MAYVGVCKGDEVRSEVGMVGVLKMEHLHQAAWRPGLHPVHWKPVNGTWYCKQC